MKVCEIRVDELGTVFVFLYAYYKIGSDGPNYYGHSHRYHNNEQPPQSQSQSQQQQPQQQQPPRHEMGSRDYHYSARHNDNNRHHRQGYDETQIHTTNIPTPHTRFQTSTNYDRNKENRRNFCDLTKKDRSKEKKKNQAKTGIIKLIDSPTNLQTTKTNVFCERYNNNNNNDTRIKQHNDDSVKNVNDNNRGLKYKYGDNDNQCNDNKNNTNNTNNNNSNNNGCNNKIQKQCKNTINKIQPQNKNAGFDFNGNSNGKSNSKSKEDSVVLIEASFSPPSSLEPSDKEDLTSFVCVSVWVCECVLCVLWFACVEITLVLQKKHTKFFGLCLNVFKEEQRLLHPQ